MAMMTKKTKKTRKTNFSSMKLSKEQEKHIQELEAWFASELIRIKKKELDIMRRYDEAKKKVMQNKLSKRIAKM